LAGGANPGKLTFTDGAGTPLNDEARAAILGFNLADVYGAANTTKGSINAVNGIVITAGGIAETGETVISLSGGVELPLTITTGNTLKIDFVAETTLLALQS
jgi:hypothetical protein